jgi:hypothetical protein
MLKYLFGILLIQIVTVSLVLFLPRDVEGIGWLQLFIPLFSISLVAAFWFSTIAEHLRKDELSKLKENHFKEREKIRVNAERAKTRAIKKTQKEMTKEVSKTHSRANFKVVTAFSGAVGVGVFMMFTELMTFGLLTLTTMGGGLGGYLFRAKKEKRQEDKLLNIQGEQAVVKVIKNPLLEQKNKKS